ncbi:MAG: histidine phosphatase family protein [Bacilli bacterium]|nr:histidine phosphatase family protein [Bacilli bacterium]
MDLYFIRHGYPDYDNDSLTEEGKRQAEETSKVLSKIRFEKIFCSPLGRAKLTAEYTAKKLNTEPVVLPWTSENLAGSQIGMFDEKGVFNWIFWIDKTKQKMIEKQGDPNWYSDPIFKESVKEGVDRINKELDAWLLSLGLEHDREKKIYKKVGKTPENIALFAHGGMATLFMSSILDMNYAEFVSHFYVHETCGVTHIHFEETETTSAYIVSYNRTFY